MFQLICSALWINKEGKLSQGVVATTRCFVRFLSSPFMHVTLLVCLPRQMCLLFLSGIIMLSWELQCHVVNTTANNAHKAQACRRVETLARLSHVPWEQQVTKPQGKRSLRHSSAGFYEGSGVVDNVWNGLKQEPSCILFTCNVKQTVLMLHTWVLRHVWRSYLAFRWGSVLTDKKKLDLKTKSMKLQRNRELTRIMLC